MAEDSPDPLRNPDIILRENNEEIMQHLQQSRRYRFFTAVKFTSIFLGFLVIANIAFYFLSPATTGIDVLGRNLFLGALSTVLYSVSRQTLNAFEMAAAKQLGYSWETPNTP